MGDVSFTPQALGIVTSLLVAMVSAITALFWQLLKAKSEQMDAAEKQIKELTVERDYLLGLALRATGHADRATQVAETTLAQLKARVN